MGIKENILSSLKNADDYVSGQELCEQLGVSRTAVWKQIKSLEEEGYRIAAVRNKGYLLTEVPDLITKQEIQSYLKTAWLGRTLYAADSVDSTNNQIKRLAENGAPHGTVVIADEQTCGKGRRGRTWVTPKRAAIALSKLLRPAMDPERASMLTLVEGLSVAQAIRSLYGLEALIKWPNDVVLSGKKVCGILTEMSAEVDYISYIVIGIGINTNLDRFPQELADRATSLQLELGRPVRRAPLVAAILSAFEGNYEKFCRTWNLQELLDDYQDILVNRDAAVQVEDARKTFTGIARGIDSWGRLLVESDSGGTVLVYAGEVSVRGLYGYV